MTFVSLTSRVTIQVIRSLVHFYHLCLILTFSAIALIFSVFWLTALVGLFYYIFGTVTYQGVCAPLRDRENNSLFSQIDPEIDLNKFLSEHVIQMNVEKAEDWEAHRKMVIETERAKMRSGGNVKVKRQTVPLRMSTAIKACEADESIFELMHQYNIYDIDELSRLQILQEHKLPNGTIFDANITEFVMLTNDEQTKLTEIQYSNLTDYHSSIFIQFLCDKMTPVPLPKVIQEIKQLEESLKSEWGRYDLAKVALANAANNLERYHYQLVDKIKSTMNEIKQKLKQIDNLILYEGLPFGESLQTLVTSIKNSQEFIRTNAENYVAYLRTNLTTFVDTEASDYTDMVLTKGHNEVGKCRPLAYIYYKGVDLICRRLVYPLVSVRRTV